MSVKSGWLLAAGLCAIVMLGAACGGESSSRISELDTETVQSESVQTTQEPPAPATPSTVLASTDAVIVDLSNEMVTVSRGTGLRDQEQIYSQSRVIPGWEQPIGIDTGYGLTIHAFSADFSRAVFSGRPEGLLADHIGVIDLRTGEVTDLTAARQGGDFADAVLCEDTAGFVTQLSPKVRNGDDEILFLTRNGTNEGPGWCFGEPAVTRLSQPSTVAPTTADNLPLSQRVQGSADGAYWFGIREDEDGRALGEGFVEAATGRVTAPNCVSGQEGMLDHGDENEELLGWTGPRQVAIGVVDPPGSSAVVDYRLATLGSDGKVTCSGGLPKTGKTTSGVDLSFDAQSILFTVEGVSGPEQYSVGIEGGDTPIPAEFVDLDSPSDVTIYRAGPQ